jgi:prephenate dehydrogenase
MSEQLFLSPLEDTVVIVGVGLIGGSLAAALKHRNVARTVIGVGRDAARIESARVAGLIDEATTDIASVIRRANLVVFCTPVDRVATDVRVAEEALKKKSSTQLVTSGSKSDLLLTDVGSVKAPICEELAGVFRFIGSHPIAGSHRQGFEAADAKLFEGRMCVVTPVATSPAQQVNRLEKFWQAVGMRTVQMSPAAHDHSLAMTSHLPHLIAATLASTLSSDNRHLTGSGFRDTTRVAAGDPALWTAIMLSNAESILRGIDEFQQKIAAWREALASRNAEEIQKLLTEGQTARAALDKTVIGID